MAGEKQTAQCRLALPCVTSLGECQTSLPPPCSGSPCVQGCVRSRGSSPLEASTWHHLFAHSSGSCLLQQHRRAEGFWELVRVEADKALTEGAVGASLTLRSAMALCSPAAALFFWRGID